MVVGKLNKYKLKKKTENIHKIETTAIDIRRRIVPCKKERHTVETQYEYIYIYR